ncbi:MAG: hypothetical protein HYZ44_17135 [Bacteroidetes bacterium]|nr:hypothetical protein [Bacteroidota bacterium]
MKKLLSCWMIAMVLLQASCNNEKTAAAPDVKALLTGSTWKIKTVTVDGMNKNDLFTNLSVTFTATEFTALNGGLVWPASGTWTLSGADQRTIIRNDGTQITVAAISETELTLQLMWSKTTLGSGRVESIQGNHTFTFGK